MGTKRMIARTLIAIGAFGVLGVFIGGQLNYRAWDDALNYCINTGSEDGLGYTGYLGEVNETSSDKSLFPYGAYCNYVNDDGPITIFRDHGTEVGTAFGLALLTGLVLTISRRRATSPGEGLASQIATHHAAHVADVSR